jgi:hypothetical protein
VKYLLTKDVSLLWAKFYRKLTVEYVLQSIHKEKETSARSYFHHKISENKINHGAIKVPPFSCHLVHLQQTPLS